MAFDTPARIDHTFAAAATDAPALARRVVGVGSVGTRCYVILLHGRDERDPLVLQLKEVGPSVLEPYVASTAAEARALALETAGQRAHRAPAHPNPVNVLQRTEEQSFRMYDVS